MPSGAIADPMLPKHMLCRFRKVLWGSPSGDDREGRERGRNRNAEHTADPRDDSNFADTSSDLRVFARTGRMEVESDALADLLAQPDFDSTRFIQQYMAQLNTAGLESARGELEKFMTHVQNQVRLLLAFDTRRAPAPPSFRVLNRLATIAAESDGVEKHVFVRRAQEALSVARVRGNGYVWKQGLQAMAYGGSRCFQTGVDRPAKEVG